MLTKKNIYNYLMVIGIGLFPIYLFPNGSIQITHIVLFIAAIFFMFNEFKKEHLNGFAAQVVLFTLLWIFFRQTVYSIQVQSFELVPFFYVLFNAIISYFIVHLIYKYGRHSIDLIFYATLAAISVTLIFSLFSGVSLQADPGAADNSFRGLGSFNNANQLGYFSVCSLGILTSIWARFGIKPIFYFAGFGASFLLAIISLSKAAIIANVVYLTLWFGFQNRYRIATYLLVIAMAVQSIFIDFGQFKFIGRLSRMGTEQDGILSRGYVLFENITWGFIFGEGKGYDQVHLPFGIEFHSTFGSLLLAYGLIGFIPIVYLFWKFFMRMVNSESVFFAMSMLFPYILYGITHNGFRSTLSWVFLSMTFAIIRIPKTELSRAEKRAGGVQAKFA